MEKVLAIFDMDGVLVNTLPMLEGVYGKFLDSYGCRGSRKEFSRLNGYTIREIVEYLKPLHGLQPETEELLAVYLGLIDSSMRDAKLSEGAKETLAFLKEQGCSIGVASSASRKYITTMFEAHGIEKYFDFIVSGDDVKKAKPSTEIYERAAGMCEFERCYIIEDSDNGLKAAHIGDQRCRSVFYQGTQVSSLVPYSYRINDLRQLKEIVLQPQELQAFVPYKEFALECVQHSRFTKAQEQEAEEVWQREKERRPGLFNGAVMFFGGLKENGEAVTLQIYESEYKYYKWAMYRRKCSSPVPVLSMAVSAILLDPEGNTLLARRGEVTQYEDLYELVPSGGLDAARFYGGAGHPEQQNARGMAVISRQILEELEQELNGTVGREEVREIVPVGLSCDIADQVLDICVLVRLKYRLRDLQLCSNEEYKTGSLKVISLDELLGARQMHDQMVPTSLEIVKHLAGRR